MQPFETYLECFLWDLVDEGIDAVLDRIKGETGVRGIVVPVHHPGVMQFRPHTGVSPRTFVSQGGAQFQPDGSRYAGTRIRPAVDDWLRKSNPFKAAVQGCKDRGLKVAAAVRACMVPAVARRFEPACVRDVWGDRDEWLCPVNPDVQEYVRCLLTDLSENYTLDAVAVGFLGFGHTGDGRSWSRWNEHRGFELGPVETWLRSVCFCESCRQLAKRDGLDVDAAVGIASDTLEAACAGNACRKEPIADFVAAHPALRVFLDWRGEQLRRWLPTLEPACRCDLIVDAHQEPLRSGLEMSDIAACCDAVLGETTRTDAKQVEQWTQWGQRFCEPSRMSLRVSAGVRCDHSESLVAAVSAAARAGCRAVHIGDYGSVPLSRLEWIRQAVRFAHRQRET